MRAVVYFFSAFFATLTLSTASHGDIPAIDGNSWIWLIVGGVASGFAAVKGLYDSKTTDARDGH